MGARRHLPRFLLVVAAPILLSACGGLTTPDLSVGEITGRLDGVADPASAHVYVLGRPETVTAVAADGSYTLRKVPVGDDVKVVFFDGKERAGVVSAGKVESAKRKGHDQDASSLGRAARVHVLARGATGAKTDATAFTVEETVLRERTNPAGSAEAVVLYPVPAGEWSVRGALKGFRPETVALSLGEGADVTLEVEIDEPDDSDEKGCRSTSCSDGLRCDGDDGRCYACAFDADCGAGLQCDDHVCVQAGTSDRDACEPCTVGLAQCGPGGECKSSGTGISGYCAPAVSSGCDAGFAVKDALCVPPSWPARPLRDACAKLFGTFGSPCLSDAACQSLAGGVCTKPAGAGASTPGTCTAPCARSSDCPKEIGFGACAAGLCARGS